MIILPTVILRHKKENLKKCSLRGIESREDCLFFTYPKHSLPPLDQYILLSMDGEPLSEKDNRYGLFLIDGTWKYASVMYQSIPNKENLIKRRLPDHIRTAYPRKQTDCSDPERGLASIEALYVAYLIMGRDTKGLLDHYHWKELFINQNDFITHL